MKRTIITALLLACGFVAGVGCSEGEDPEDGPCCQGSCNDDYDACLDDCMEHEPTQTCANACDAERDMCRSDC
jgi:hypothetical protein